MNKKKRRSFFDRLTGGIHLEDDDIVKEEFDSKNSNDLSVEKQSVNWEDEEAQLTVDLYQTPTEIIIQTMVAGVQPENFKINITRNMITLKGKRHEQKTINEEDYFARELYWGSFSRSISLPAEVEPENAEATEKHGLVTIRIPKIDKSKQANLRVKSI